MRYILAIFLIVSFIHNLQAQDTKIDSINNLIAHAKTDTARINLLNAIAGVYTENNLDSAISIARATIEKAKGIHYQKGEADAHFKLGIALTYKGAFAPADSSFTSAEVLYKQIPDSDGLNKLYIGYGMYYGMQSKYDSSIVFFQKNIAFNERKGRTKDLASSYQNVAVSYTMMGDYQQALLYQGKALHIAESTNDLSNMAYINLNMAISYSNISDYVKCEELNLKAIQYAQQAQIKNVELYGYANIASACSMLNRYQETYTYAMKAVMLGKQLGDYAIVASSLSRAGAALASQKQFAKAETITAEAIHIADSVGTPLNIYQTNSDMGFIKKEEQQYTDAITFYEKAFATIKNVNIYDGQTFNSYSALSESYEKTGKYEKALTTYKIAQKISDSLKSRENIRKGTELTMNYTFDKKQQAEQAAQQKKDATAKTRQTLLIGGLLLMIILAAVAWYAFTIKKKTNSLLHQQKAALQSALNDLKNTQVQLIHSEKMASLGELTAGIAHEIQNPLNFVNNFSEVNNELIEELQAERSTLDVAQQDELLQDISQNNEKINHHGKRADAIVKGMLQHSRQTKGMRERTDVNALCDEYLRLSYHGLRAKDKSFNSDYATSFDESIGMINIVPQDIGRVLLNLFNNAFYAVSEKQRAESIQQKDFKPLVSVQTKKYGDTVEIRIADNGMGIPKNITDKIFQPFFTTKPTGQGTGLGLSLSYDIVKAHEGTIAVKSQEDEGTEFIIILSVQK